MKEYDYLIVGAGFSGAVLAERLRSINKRVLVIEKRGHIGGNSFDYYDDNGVLIHKYGPHYFRTNNKIIFDYLSKFTLWRSYEYRVKTCVDGVLYPFPINRDTINLFYNINLTTDELCKKFLDSKRIHIKKPKNAEEQVTMLVGTDMYEKFFKNYTIKQWNTNPKNLDPSVTARIPIRYNQDDRYFNDQIQAMPLNGYYRMFQNILEGTEIMFNTNFYDIKDEISYRNLIFTGPIDQFFNYSLGKLPYRSLRFEHENFKQEFYQQCVQINYPNDYDFTRIVEIKHATGQKCNTTTIIKEFPLHDGDPFYPIPNKNNQQLYLRYHKKATKLKNKYFIGRLATYQYLNMDQIVGKALDFFKRIRNK